MILNFIQSLKARLIDFSRGKINQKRPSQKAERDFYRAASEWAYDKYHSQGVWLRWSIFANLAQCIFLILTLFALIALIPLKQQVPYLYAFNTASGEITKIGELEKTALTDKWQMARYFLRQYVLYREGFDSDNLDYPYQIAWAMSSDSVRLQYDREVDSRSPRSAISRYGKDHFVTVEILSVSRLNANTAEVRFKKILQNKPLTKREISYQAAIIKWDYVKPDTTQKMLDRNPLGFKVIYYKTSEIESDNAS